MRAVFAVLILCFISSCQPKGNDKTYFGGKIINPQSNFIILCQQDHVLDTIPLDNHGHFHYNFDLESPSLFTFKHDFEFQTFYAEPFDSITLRLNTKEFDESLVFGGNKAHENNFLIENYLLNQKNSNLIMSYYKIAPTDFESITDSIKHARQEKLEYLEKNFEISASYKNLAEKSIDFEYYDMRERYAFLLKKFFPKKASKISATFFDYRKKLDFNDLEVLDLIGYQRFLDNYLKNKSIEICHEKNALNCNDLGSITNLDVRIKLVDSLITNRFIRKRYLERFIQEEVVFARTKKQLEHTKNHLSKFDLSENEKFNIELLAEFQESFLVNYNLGDVKIKSSTFKTLALKDIVNHDHCIIYSWSVHSPSHHKFRLKKIKELQKSYPNIQLIGLNIDYNHPKEWLNALGKHDANIGNEYQIVPEEHAMFYRNYLNKILFIDNDCTIKKSETIISDVEFDKHLKDFVGL